VVKAALTAGRASPMWHHDNHAAEPQKGVFCSGALIGGLHPNPAKTHFRSFPRRASAKETRLFSLPRRGAHILQKRVRPHPAASRRRPGYAFQPPSPAVDAAL